jgi:hypothetical protein
MLVLALKMEVICFSETSVHIRTKQRYIPEYVNIHNHSCENLKSYTVEEMFISEKDIELKSTTT